MSVLVCLYEDSHYADFFPLTFLRPVFALRAGIVPLHGRLTRYFPDARKCFAVREQLAPLVAEVHRDIPVNIVKKEDSDVMLLNGRIREYGDLPTLVERLTKSTKIVNGDHLVAVLMKSRDLKSLGAVSTPQHCYDHVVARKGDLDVCTTSASVYNYLWEIMADIPASIRTDFRTMEKDLKPASGLKVHEGAFWVNKDDIYLGDDVEVLPGSVLDASDGPIYIGGKTRIEPHAAIYGPTYIGPGCTVLAGKITASSIGHTSRVGGEVEQCTFHSCVNKYHDGFMGHSCVGSWVNFGAMTTNSDLKNNYSAIRVSVNGKLIDSGSNKVGSFIGDHTKFGIGTLLNTGINIGVSCNIFGGTLVTDKEIPSFSWGGTGFFRKFSVEKAIETAKIVAGRRQIALSESEVAVLHHISGGTLESKGIFDTEEML